MCGRKAQVGEDDYHQKRASTQSGFSLQRRRELRVIKSSRDEFSNGERSVPQSQEISQELFSLITDAGKWK